MRQSYNSLSTNTSRNKRPAIKRARINGSRTSLAKVNTYFEDHLVHVV